MPDDCVWLVVWPGAVLGGLRRHGLSRRLALQRTVRVVGLARRRRGSGFGRGRRDLRHERRGRARDVQRHDHCDCKADNQAQHDTEKGASGLFRLLRRAAWFCHRMNHLQKVF
jgi:hypothetical protein